LKFSLDLFCRYLREVSKPESSNAIMCFLVDLSGEFKCASRGVILA